MSDTQPMVIKIGGHEISDADFLTGLAQAVAHLHTHGQPVIIVHGGGKEISDLQRALGIQPQYIDGLRITDAPSLDVVQMVLAGLVNKRLVGYLLAVGVDATGLTGVDRGIVRAQQMHHPAQDMGFTGIPTTVRADVLCGLTVDHVVPVIAPLCLAEDAPNRIYNVNADHVAGAVGAAVDASRVVFITNVPGVMADGGVMPHLSAAHARSLVADGTISGGMIPKVNTALEVLAQGVPQAVITNLDGLKAGTGTTFAITSPEN